MNKYFLLCALQCISIYPLCQDETPKPTLEESLIRKEAVYLANRFQIAVAKSFLYEKLDMRGTQDLFAEDATIQVTSLRTHTKKEYTPQEYFQVLNLLRWGSTAIYDLVKVSYAPIDRSSGSLSNRNGYYQIVYNITQTFRGRFKNRQGYYCDITVKQIIIHLKFNKQGIVEGKITDIIAVQTTDCDANETVSPRR